MKTVKIFNFYAIIVIDLLVFKYVMTNSSKRQDLRGYPDLPILAPMSYPSSMPLGQEKWQVIILFCESLISNSSLSVKLPQRDKVLKLKYPPDAQN